MSLFEKKETIFKERNKPLWTKIKEGLKSAGIKAFCGSYDVEPPFVGCGCKLDVRDFSGNGKIDRKMYFIDVKVSQLEQARAVMEQVRSQNLELELDQKVRVSYY